MSNFMTDANLIADVFRIGKTGDTAGTAYMTLDDIVHVIPVSKTSVDRWISEQKFPPATTRVSRGYGRGGHFRLWLRSDVEAWVAAKASEMRGDKP